MPHISKEGKRDKTQFQTFNYSLSEGQVVDHSFKDPKTQKIKLPKFRNLNRLGLLKNLNYQNLSLLEVVDQHMVGPTLLSF